MSKLLPEHVNVAEFDLTTTCNAKCPLCMRQTEAFSTRYSTPFNRDVSDLLKQVDGFLNLESVYLIGQMSEPTLHPDFLPIVRELKRRGLRLKICTNGSTRDGHFWRTLGSILDESDRVWFAVCGSTQDIHSKYRVGTSLPAILEHARELRSERKVDGAKCIRFMYNAEDLAGYCFREMVSEFSFVEYTDTCIQDGSCVSDDFLPTGGMFDAYRKADVVSRFVGNVKSGVLCQSVMEGSVQIDPYGNVYPCYRYMENADGKWDMDYSEILSGGCHMCRYCTRAMVEYAERAGLGAII